MAAETRLAVVLFGSFVLWSPALTAFLRGDLGAGAVGVRFAGAVAVVWVAIAVLAGIVSGYRPDASAADEDVGAPPRRRADDQAPEPAPAADAPADEPSASPLSGASGG